jgi:hypothetical protein
MLNWTVDVRNKCHFYMNIEKNLTFTKITWLSDVHAKFASEWQPLIGDQRPHMMSPHNALTCLWVDIHVGLMYMVILMVIMVKELCGINVGKKIIHQSKMGCLGS